MDKITKNLQFILLSIILISTVIAVGIEIKKNDYRTDCKFSRSSFNVSVFRSNGDGKSILEPTIN